MQALFVNCCPRGDDSRTLRLAHAFLARLRERIADLRIAEQNPYLMQLSPVWGDTLALREKLCDAQDWDHPLIRPAAQMAASDLLVIAAPYWDLSFPSALKIWIEHMWIRNLTFRYRDDQPVGLCKASRAVYITSSGSFIASHDWGTLYVEDCLKTLGVPSFHAIKAEALDLDRSDPASILSEAKERALLLADETAAFYQKA